MPAYLVIREGPKWTDVYRLVEGRTVTVGRAPSSSIVVRDERCSRFHAEVFFSGGKWILRDQDSRNGTEVHGNAIRGDHILIEGDIVRIAHAQLAFFQDLAKAFPDASELAQAKSLVAKGEHDGSRRDSDDDVVGGPDPTVDLAEVDDDSSVLLSYEPTTITHRRGKSIFSQPDDASEEMLDDHTSVNAVAGKTSAGGLRRTSTSGPSDAVRQLYRLAFELANQTDAVAVADRALEYLVRVANVDAGAVYVVPRDFTGTATEADLALAASRTKGDKKYHRLSTNLFKTVLRDGEAVLARTVEEDSSLGRRDSRGEIMATSVLCAPIRHDGNVVGIVHLYSTVDDRRPGPQELELTLAVADNMALALKNLNREQQLTENLTQTQDEIVELRRRLGAESDLVGSSPEMSAVHDQILQAAPVKATVLIRGESGVGKELVARAVHFNSPRKNNTFVCLNCAALSETLLESELFGHERGAFTGATERKVGKFEAADGGTLMLDEIGEMSESIQAKFLRVLEGHPFERVGGSEAIKTDVRVIAATNRDLEKAVAEKKFRRDLYFRLNVVEIRVPPLRKRDAQDIVDLAEYFLQRYKEETGKKLAGFSPEAMEQLKVYRWPGNVRELKNVVERAVVLARGRVVGLEDLHLSNLATAGDSGYLAGNVVGDYEPMTLAEGERRLILAALSANGWNKSQTAAVLGIERSTLDRKIRRYELTRDNSARSNS